QDHLARPRWAHRHPVPRRRADSHRKAAGVSVLVSLTGAGGGPSLHTVTTAPARRLHGRRLASSWSAVSRWRLGASRPAAMRTQETRLAGQDSGVGAVWPPAAFGMVDT